jgi:hypothetical protein
LRPRILGKFGWRDSSSHGNLLSLKASKYAAELQHPFPSTSLSGEGPEGGVAAVSAPFCTLIPGPSQGFRCLRRRVRRFRIRYTKYMKSFCRLLFCLACTVAVVPALAQEGPLDNAQPTGISPEEIIKRFAEKETEFAKAREQYTYRQDVKVQTVDGSTVDGEYHEVFDVLFDDKGHRIENVVFAPQSSLQKIYMSREDMEDIRHKLPFVLTTEDLPEYNILYVGQQQEDELHCYVFDIAPKKIEGKKRYFQGRVWVDDHDFQIVKTYGKTVPDIRSKHGDQENLFPKFTTWRQQIDGQYWFPVYTKADDELHFKMEDVHIKEIVKYEDYKRFGSNVKILYEGKELPKGDQKPQNPPPDQKKPQ